MTNLLIALFLILFEACYEGFGLRKWNTISEIMEDIYILVIAYVLFSGGIPQTGSFIHVFIGYIMFRYAIFDAVFNLAAGQSLFYIGKKKFYDRALKVISDKWQGHMVFISKGIAFFWGLIWLLGGQYGITNIFK